MTEQEIIYCLKENKIKGVAYFFLPEQVRDWVHDKLFDKTLLILNGMGNFIPFDDVEEGLINTVDYDNVVFALPDDYKVEPKGEWVEFEIDGDGDFNLKDDGTESTKDEARDFGFHWLDVGEFLKCSINEKWHYTTFGGWQYKDNERWYLAPAVKLQDGDLWNSYVIEQRGEATPAIPIKIRFWRESK